MITSKEQTKRDANAVQLDERLLLRCAVLTLKEHMRIVCIPTICTTINRQLSTISIHSHSAWLLMAASTTLQKAPNKDGIPCRLLMPHVSNSPNRFCRKLCTRLKPKVLRMPAIVPMNIAPHSCGSMFADAPMATPPARVAFWMSTMLNFPSGRSRREARKLANVDDAMERMVLMTDRCCALPVLPAKAPLKLGQYSHRNSVPVESAISDHQWRENLRLANQSWQTHPSDRPERCLPSQSAFAS